MSAAAGQARDFSMRAPRLCLLASAVLLAPTLLVAQAQPVRLAHDACDWGHAPGVAWGHDVLAFTSEAGGAARRATGRPDVYPSAGVGSWDSGTSMMGGGSIPNTSASAGLAPARVWSPSRRDVYPEWIALGLRQPVPALELWLFVTGGAGAELRIALENTDGSMTPVAHLPAVEWPIAAALIAVPLDSALTVSGIRVEVEPTSLDEPFLLDAVAAVPRRVCVPAPAAPRVTP
jgi:hypothetical protein